MSKGLLVLSEDGVKAVRLDDKGREIPDNSRPVIPLGFKKPEGLNEMVQRFVRHAISVQAASQGKETFEEADDFDVEDDQALPETPYEVDFDPVLGKDVSLSQLREHERKLAYAERAGAREALRKRAGKRGAGDREEVQGGRKEVQPAGRGETASEAKADGGKKDAAGPGSVPRQS